MALVEFGGGVSQIVGRVGGNVFQRGRAGSQLRTLPINTGRKQNQGNFARGSLSSSSSYWRTLSEARKATWNALALTQTRYNRVGTPYTPSAFQVFNELQNNAFLVAAGVFLTTAPAPSALPSFSGTTVDISSGGTSYAIDGTIVGGSSDWLWLIEATRPQGAGVQVNRAPFLIISATDDLSAVPTDQWSQYIRRIGFGPNEGQVIFTRISAIEAATGWRIPSQIIRSIVAA